MSGSNYRRGADLERAAKKYLEDNGYYVIKSAGSKGVADSSETLIQVGVHGELLGFDAGPGAHDGSPVKGRVSAATAAAISGSVRDAARRCAQADSSAHSHSGPGCRVMAGSRMS